MQVSDLTFCTSINLFCLLLEPIRRLPLWLKLVQVFFPDFEDWFSEVCLVGLEVYPSLFCLLVRLLSKVQASQSCFDFTSKLHVLFH